MGNATIKRAAKPRPRKNSKALRAAIPALLLGLTLCVSPALARADDPVPPARQTLVFTFAGDCTLGCDDRWLRDARAFPNVVEREGYGYPFARVRDFFAADDLTVVNLEGVLQDTDAGKQSGRVYNFRGPAAYTEILRLGSVELVTLGNNHAGDFSNEGLRSTQAALDAAGVGWCYDQTAFVYEKNGVRVGFLGYLGDHYKRDREAVAAQIAALKAERGCDAVVLLLHDGEEYAFRHDGSQRRIAWHAIDSGADLVIGCHPHVVQGVEQYQGRAICYSLGNFVFGGNRHILAEHRDALVVRAELDFGPDGYLGQRVRVYPASATGSLERNDYQPYLLEDEEAARVLRLVQEDSTVNLAALWSE